MTNHSALRRTKPPVLRTNSGQTLEDPDQLIEGLTRSRSEGLQGHKAERHPVTSSVCVQLRP